MTMRRVMGAAATVGAFLAAMSAATLPSAADDNGTKLFNIDDARVTESSGLARSTGHDGIWWTANDSSDSARVFAVTADGSIEATLTFGATPRDVEALGVGSDGSLYIADIGDNLSNQEMISVYVLREPEPLQDQRVRYRRYDFAYPDGPHNAETLLVEPRTDRLYVVTKEGQRGGIYAAPEQPSRQKVNRLRKVGSAPPIVTDGTFTPDGKRVILRDPTAMTVYDWPEMKSPVRAELPLQPLGESIAMGPDDSSVLVGSEGKRSAVYQVRIPSRSSATAAPTPSPNPASAAGNGAGKQGHAMRWTLAGSAAAAVLIAVLTFPKGRRERADELLEVSAPVPRRSQRLG